MRYEALRAQTETESDGIRRKQKNQSPFDQLFCEFCYLLYWPVGFLLFFFFSSRRRHTRFDCDWSSDVSLPISQHDLAWCDELAAWRYPAAWDMLMFGLRLGDDPRVVVTTTPRPIKLVRELLADAKVVVTRGRTVENRNHLAPAFLDQIVRRYEGTRLGRQELDGEILDDMPGALWSHGLIDAARVSATPDLVRIVVAIDPAVSSSEHSDETGIIVAGKDNEGHGY